MNKVSVVGMIMLCFFISGCGSTQTVKLDSVENDGDRINMQIAGDNAEKMETESSAADISNMYDQLVITCNPENPEEQVGPYSVYLVIPGSVKTMLDTENNSATRIGPFITDDNNQVVIDLTYNYDIAYLFEADSKDAEVEIIVVTEEDKEMKNPLTLGQIVHLYNVEYDSFVVEKEDYTVSFVDAYPEGVLSLYFPDASFIIRLAFPEGFEPKSSYEMGLVMVDPNYGSDYYLGRINRAWQYWDLPFFESDSLENKNGRVFIRDFDTNEMLNYEESPLELTFDENGKCIQGDIVTITFSP